MDWRSFFFSFFFSFRGRINRAKYWLAVLVFVVVGIVLGLVGWALGNGVAFQILSFVVNLAVLIAGVAVCIKRLHDRDRSAWWLLPFYVGPGVFILIGGAIMWASADAVGMAAQWSYLLLRLCLLGGFALAIWGLVEFGCRRGTAGYNRFGPDPLKAARSK
jgi:uncharacterized membrane protein YhaH (DUF805 family)